MGSLEPDFAKQEAFDEWFRVEATLDWVQSNNKKRVALQLPDSLLRYAFRLSERLQSGARARGMEAAVFVLGDTSYGECCVDQTSAAHNAADCVVHYGRSCLSRPTYLPTFLVFNDVGAGLDLAKSVKPFAQERSGKKVYVELDVRFEGARSGLEEIFKDASCELTISEPPPRELVPTSIVPDVKQEVHQAFESFDAVLFIGPIRSPQLDRIAFACATANMLEVYSLNPETLDITKSESTRAIARRFTMIEKCRDASIIGILVGTMSVALFRDVLSSVKKSIEESGKKSYTFVFGKLSPSKLANFPEVDCFVLIACKFNILIDSKEFNKPIITPFELEVALHKREWGQYIWDFADILDDQSSTEKDASGKEVSQAREEEEEVRFSLATGKMVQLPKKRPQVSTVALRYESPAANSLAERTFRGLDPSTALLTPTKAQPGQMGVASRLYNIDDKDKSEAR